MDSRNGKRDIVTNCVMLLWRLILSVILRLVSMSAFAIDEQDFCDAGRDVEWWLWVDFVTFRLVLLKLSGEAFPSFLVEIGLINSCCFLKGAWYLYLPCGIFSLVGMGWVW